MFHKNKLDKLIKRASSVLGCPLDSVDSVGERRMLAKLSANTSHPLYKTVGTFSSSFSHRLLHPQCKRERRSFV